MQHVSSREAPNASSARTVAFAAFATVAPAPASPAVEPDPSPSGFLPLLAPPPSPSSLPAVPALAAAPRLTSTVVAPVPSAPPRRTTAGAAPDDTVGREALLVVQARTALGRGDPQGALRAIHAARMLPSHQLGPEELAVEAQALRALGKDDQAKDVDSTLRKQFPESALAR